MIGLDYLYRTSHTTARARLPEQSCQDRTARIRWQDSLKRTARTERLEQDSQSRQPEGEREKRIGRTEQAESFNNVDISANWTLSENI
jgi:hypothetical protein